MALEFEQPLLQRQTAAEPCEAAIVSDHAMPHMTGLELAGIIGKELNRACLFELAERQCLIGQVDKRAAPDDSHPPVLGHPMNARIYSRGKIFSRLKDVEGCQPIGIWSIWLTVYDEGRFLCKKIT